MGIDEKKAQNFPLSREDVEIYLAQIVEEIHYLMPFSMCFRNRCDEHEYLEALKRAWVLVAVALDVVQENRFPGGEA